ncbi:MAG: hypothetical protein E7287_01930 [Lachnospiraceae bacterium]|nr:hypothetical protein [Lachnospiraceae bacterium]
MKKIILNILATTGISLVALALVATCYDATLICIDTVFQVLGLNVIIYIGLYFMDYIEYRYPILETGLKLLYVMILVLLGGWIWGWYSNLPGVVLILMTIGIFVVCVCLDTVSLLSEVKSINILIEGEGQSKNISL